MRVGERRGPGGRIGLIGRLAGVALAAATILAVGTTVATPAATAAAAAGAAPTPAAARMSSQVEVVQTSADLGDHMTRLPDLDFGRARPQGIRGIQVIHVNDRVRYQRINGFGAALTDSSAWLIEDQLLSDLKDELMSKLFGIAGIHLSFVRVPIGASDFTRDGRPYSYDDMPARRSDPSLRHFSIAHDLAYIIPVLRQALFFNPHLEILATPWSPPAWMKTNHAPDNSAHAGKLRVGAYRPLAEYFVRFIRAYAHAGIPVTGITPQNEPTNPTSYPGLQLPERAEASWITNFLEPALAGAGLHPRVYGNDYGWSGSGASYATRLASRGTAGGLAGIAWHCYFGSPEVMTTLHHLAPRLDQMVDECSPGISPFPVAETLISSLRNWASTVALWNLALDPQGGPVQPPNTGCPSCSGVVTVDEGTHAATLGLGYYELGQVSTYVRPGAQRIASEHFISYAYHGPGRNFSPGLDDVAFRNRDGSEVLVVYDNSPAALRFAVESARGWLTYTLPPQAMVTLIWNRAAR